MPWNKRNPKAIEEAIECFQKAIASDSGHAAAYAGLADCRAAQAWFETGPPAELWKEAESEASRAQVMDPSAAQPLTTIAFKMAAFDWEWKKSELAFREAIVLNPGYATARHWYGFFCLTPQRRVKAAIEELTRACALDPLSPAIGTHLGCVLYFRRSYREAVDQHLRAIELDPGFHLAYWHLGFSYIQLSLFDEANAALTQANDLGCGEPSYFGALGYLQAAPGNREESERQLAALNKLAEKSYVSPVSFALVYAALDDRDSAFQWLDQAIRERSPRLIHIKVEPAFDKLKTDPRFVFVLSALDLL